MWITTYPGTVLQEFKFRNARIFYGRSADFCTDTCKDILSDEERLRAVRMQNEKHRNTFIACRVALRTILGNLSGRLAGQITINISLTGKPCLPEMTLDFSISHTPEAFLIGINPEGMIGVDMEMLNGGENLCGIVDYAFSEKERQYCDSGKDPTKFLEVWTNKEALLKLNGRGFSANLKEVCTLTENLFACHPTSVQRMIFAAPGGETCCVVLLKS